MTDSRLDHRRPGLLAAVRQGHPALRLVSTSLIIQAALVVSGPLVVRLLGVESRGELALVFALVLLVSRIGVAGIPDALGWFIASRGLSAPVLIRQHARVYAVLCVLASVSAGAVVLGLAAAGQPLEAPAVEAALAAGGVVAIMLAVLGMAGLRGEQRFTALARLQAIPGLFYALAVLLLFLLDVRSLTLLLLLNLTGWVVVALGCFWLLRHVGDRPGEGPLPTADEVRHYARRSFLVNAAPIDNLGADQILVGLLLGQHALGFYMIGWAFETAPVLFLVALGEFVGTRLAAGAEGERPGFTASWLLRGLVLGLLVCLAIQVLLAPVLVLAFGEGTSGAITTARILVLAGVLLGLRRLGGAVLLGMGHPGWSTRAELAGFLTMLVALPALGLAWGVEGAATGMLVAGVVTVATQQWLIWRRAGRPASTGSR